MALDKDKILALQSLLDEANEMEDVYERLPDGDYGSEIDEVRLTETKETNLPMLSWTFRVIDEESAYANRLIFKNSVLNSPANTKRALSDLQKFGIDTSTVESIQDALPNLTGEILIVQLTESKDKQNQWINLIVGDND